MLRDCSGGRSIPKGHLSPVPANLKRVRLEPESLELSRTPSGEAEPLCPGSFAILWFTKLVVKMERWMFQVGMGSMSSSRK